MNADAGRKPQQVVIRDPDSGTQAQVLVGYGFNCFQFSVPAAGGTIETLWASAEFAEGTVRPSRCGIPILFPFPGRIRGSHLDWEGHQYPLEATDPLGNGIHGFVLGRPWRLIEQTDHRVRGQFHASLDDPSLLDRWPADFCIDAEYRVTAGRLDAEYTVTAPGPRPLPFGLGLHPYFRLPLGGASVEDCQVRLPVAAEWELQDMNATGRLLELQDAAAFQQGRRFGDLQLDNVFTQLQFEGRLGQAAIDDPDSGASLTIEFDDAFRELVVFTPPHREAICIEPYTCVPDCFRLQTAGVDAGLRVLEPGDAMTARMAVEIRRV